MPVRGLEQELSKREVTRMQAVEFLRNKRVGVDGMWFVRKYSREYKGNFVLVEGVNKTVLEVVRSFIERMNKMECKVVWIWNGLTPNSRMSRPYTTHRIESIKRGASMYTNDKELAHKTWATAAEYEETKRTVNKILFSMGVEVVNAPYTAAAQAAYMEKTRYINFFFGASDYFLFSGTNQLIQEFNFLYATKKHAENIVISRKEDILRSFMLSEEELTEAFLLLGCEYCLTLPKFSTPQVFSIKDILNEYLKVYKDNKEALKKESEAYYEMYLLAKASVIYHPIFTENEEIACLRNEDVPSDLDVVFGRRFSNFIYSEYARGAFSLELLRGLAFKKKMVICSTDLFRVVEDEVNLLYSKGLELFFYTFSNTDNNLSFVIKNKYMSVGKEGKVEESIGEDVIYIEGIPLALQRLIVLISKKNHHFLDNIFSLNYVGDQMRADESINWEVLEFSEGGKFSLDVLYNLENKEKVKNEVSSDAMCSVDPVNGWRMKSILNMMKNTKEDDRTFTPENLKTLKKNSSFISSFLQLISKNKLRSSKTIRTIEELHKKLTT
ncbi:hypothetical protein NEFER03_1157 [Nematocida sp. LUAm3]|nr:hypothetical protein NEFER03_1157 [Nematocida sp. LUAm3]KAI5175766.1 hypothetical protein NEFER02_1635 [Nematocida sp. LUAm2]KAI5178262.1 hypothetical protein NEFER01_1429 [Nematocida sp. LUAm1]